MRQQILAETGGASRLERVQESLESITLTRVSVRQFSVVSSRESPYLTGHLEDGQFGVVRGDDECVEYVKTDEGVFLVRVPFDPVLSMDLQVDNESSELYMLNVASADELATILMAGSLRDNQIDTWSKVSPVGLDNGRRTYRWRYTLPPNRAVKNSVWINYCCLIALEPEEEGEGGDGRRNDDDDDDDEETPESKGPRIRPLCAFSYAIHDTNEWQIYTRSPEPASLLQKFVHASQITPTMEVLDLGERATYSPVAAASSSREPETPQSFSSSRSPHGSSHESAPDIEGLGTKSHTSKVPSDTKTSPSDSTPSQEQQQQQQQQQRQQQQRQQRQATLSQSPAATNGTIMPNLAAQGDMEDGPLFRATLASLERKTAFFKKSVKSFLTQFRESQQLWQNISISHRRFIEILQSDVELSTMADKLHLLAYLKDLSQHYLAMESEMSRAAREQVIIPLEQIYMLIKKADAMKRDFEDASREYYQSLTKYLASSTDKGEDKLDKRDAKFNTRRKTFELSRFDYYTYIYELNGGRKRQDVLARIFEYVTAQAQAYVNLGAQLASTSAKLESIRQNVESALMETEQHRSNDRRRRREIEGVTRVAEGPRVPPGFIQRGNTTSTLTTAATSKPSTEKAPALATAAEIRSDSRYARPTHERNLSIDTTFAAGGSRATHKEGLLLALSRPLTHTDPKVVPKINWHKYWVVLSAGTLSEYENWRLAMDLHNEPINLHMAAVREARNVDRRFCFEVITPQIKRVYQATSDDDLHEWISAIQSAISGAIVDQEGKEYLSPQAAVAAGSNSTSPPSATASAQRSLSRALRLGRRTSSSHRTISGSLPLPKPDESGSPASEPPRASQPKLLATLQAADAANAYCADCSSPKNVEWVVINVPAIVCIECAGIHRSFGTHIGKVRSLTLDVASFTPDLVALLFATGNSVANRIYEATYNPAAEPRKPDADSATREERSRFIEAKYVHRAFVAYCDSSPNAYLLQSLESGDIIRAMHALACRAAPDAEEEAAPLLLALMHPVADVGGVRTFPLAELLVLNGVDIGRALSQAETWREGLCEAAQAYLASKQRKDPQSPGLQATLLRNPGTAVRGEEQDDAERERSGLGAILSKRISLSRLGTGKQRPAI